MALTRIAESFDSNVAAGTTIATSNSVYGSAGTTAAVFDATHVHSGGFSAKCAGAATTSYVHISNPSSGAFPGNPATVFGRGYFYFTANPAADTDIIRMEGGSANPFALLGVDTTGKIYSRNAALTKTHTGAVAIPLNAWFRIDFEFVVATSTTGETHWRLNSTNPEAAVASADETQDFTAEANGTLASAVDMKFGVVTAATATIWVDDIEVNTTAYPDASPSSEWNQRWYPTATAADAGVTAGTGTKKKMNVGSSGTGTLYNKNTVTGPTAPIQYTDSVTAGTDGTVISFYTPQLNAVTLSGNIAMAVSGAESATTANAAPSVRIERCDSTGTVISTVLAETTTQGLLEYGTSVTLHSQTAQAITSTTLSAGDRLRITYWLDDAVDQGGTGSMASGKNTQFEVEGGTGAYSAIQFNEIMSVFVPGPATNPQPIRTILQAAARSSSY